MICHCSDGYSFFNLKGLCSLDSTFKQLNQNKNILNLTICHTALKIKSDSSISPITTILVFSENGEKTNL
jgi:hypothetical protein